MGKCEDVGAFILAGGQSSRMGQPKGLLAFEGNPLVVHMARILGFTGEPVVIVGPPEIYSGLGLRVIADERRNLGPLGGIATALRISHCGWNLIVGCDLPFLTREWLEFLAERALASPADVVMPANEKGFEPLCAMYRKRAQATIAEALEHGVRKVTDGLAGLTLATIAPEEWKAFDARGLLFKNVNTAAEYDDARESLSKEQEA